MADPLVNKPNNFTNSSLPTKPVADVRLEQQTLGSGTNGAVNSYGNDPTLAQSMLNAANSYKSQQTQPALPASGGSISAPTPPSYNPFSRPTDGNGDAAGRASQYDNLMREAADSSGLTKAQREAKIQAAQGLMMPGLQQMKQQGEDFGHQAGLYANQMANGMIGSPGSSFGGGGQDFFKGLMSMFQNGNQTKPGETTPGATPATPTTPAIPPVTAPTVAPAATAVQQPTWKNTQPAIGKFNDKGAYSLFDVNG